MLYIFLCVFLKKYLFISFFTTTYTFLCKILVPFLSFSVSFVIGVLVHPLYPVVSVSSILFPLSLVFVFHLCLSFGWVTYLPPTFYYPFLVVLPLHASHYFFRLFIFFSTAALTIFSHFFKIYSLPLQANRWMYGHLLYNLHDFRHKSIISLVYC